MVTTTDVLNRKASFRREAGEGTAVVFVHGSADNHHFYDPLMDALRGVPRLAVDSPGRLGSEGAPASSATEIAEFVGAVIDREVDGGYVLAGHSLGGAVAIERALTTSDDRLKGLVLLATGARLRVHPMILQYFESLVESGKSPEPAPGLFPEGADPEMIEHTRQVLRLTPAASGLSDWRNANAFDRMQEVSQIEVPALILCGTQDTLTPPKYAEYLHAQIPTSELQLLDGAGHMFPATRAEDVAASIRSFLANL